MLVGGWLVCMGVRASVVAESRFRYMCRSVAVVPPDGAVEALEVLLPEQLVVVLVEEGEREVHAVGVGVGGIDGSVHLMCIYIHRYTKCMEAKAVPWRLSMLLSAM